MSLGALSTLGFAGCEVHAMIRVRALFEEGVSLAEEETLPRAASPAA
jgi:hypothetical protein